MTECQAGCSGCAFKPGAKAHEEVNNRLVGILSAMAGEPFQCHDRLGWTADRDGYPTGKAKIEQAMAALLAAPTLIHNCKAVDIGPEFFASERALIGRNPICQGWRQRTAEIAAQGWFKGNQEGRSAAKEALHTLQLFLAAEPKSVEWKELLEELRFDVMALVEHAHNAGLKSIF